eukprot:365517-Chlamydomonas_euryale.AAC.7
MSAKVGAPHSTSPGCSAKGGRWHHASTETAPDCRIHTKATASYCSFIIFLAGNRAYPRLIACHTGARRFGSPPPYPTPHRGSSRREPLSVAPWRILHRR